MLKNKVVLITGAFSGIGKAVTDLFMQSKCRVVAVGRNEENKVPSYAGNYLPVVRNIRTEEDAQELIDFTLEKYHDLDIILHCAGKGLMKPAQEHRKADFERVMADNFYAPVLVTQAALSHLLLKKEGTILFLPGVAGRVGLPQMVAYNAAKFGLVGYAKGLREDLKRTKIKTTCIYFGGVDTEFWNELGTNDSTRERFLSVEDAAKAVWFAAQQPASGVMSELVLQPYFHQAI